MDTQPENLTLRPIPRTSRRSFLKCSAGALLAAGFWPGTLTAESKTVPRSGSFRFVVMNDLHHMSLDCSHWLEGVVDQIRHQQRIAWTLVLGDLTDRGELENMVEVRRILRTLPHRSYVQIGNHDYRTSSDRSAYESTFPDRLNYTFRYRGWQFVGIDTTQEQRYEKTLIQEPTFSWLARILPGLNPKRPTVLFTHFPLGEGVQYRPLNSDAALDLFREFNLKAVFSGHYHAMTERKKGGCVMTTNRCCALKRGNHDGSTEKGFFLCHAEGGEITRSFVEVKPI